MGEFPSRGLYSPSDVVRLYHTYPEFHDAMEVHGLTDEVRSAEAQLWADLQIYMRRYGHLRQGVGLLFGATTGLLGVTSAVLAAGSLWP